MIEPVSTDGLRETGVFRETAGDFPGFPAFSGLFGRTAERRTAWLASGRIRTWTFPITPFEMPGDFPHFPRNLRLETFAAVT